MRQLASGCTMRVTAWALRGQLDCCSLSSPLFPSLFFSSLLFSLPLLTLRTSPPLLSLHSPIPFPSLHSPIPFPSLYLSSRLVPPFSISSFPSYYLVSFFPSPFSCLCLSNELDTFMASCSTQSTTYPQPCCPSALLESRSRIYSGMEVSVLSFKYLALGDLPAVSDLLHDEHCSLAPTHP
jgi:hypothetical protein